MTEQGFGESHYHTATPPSLYLPPLSFLIRQPYQTARGGGMCISVYVVIPLHVFVFQNAIHWSPESLTLSMYITSRTQSNRKQRKVDSDHNNPLHRAEKTPMTTRQHEAHWYIQKVIIFI